MAKYSEYLDRRLHQLSTTVSASKKRPILFIGSGISQRYFGAPNWEDLIRQLFLRVKSPHPFEYYMQDNGQDLIKVADRLVTLYKKHYWSERIKDQSPDSLYLQNNEKDIFLKYEIKKIINEGFAKFDPLRNEYTDEISALRELTPQILITTNYDELLETLFPKYTVLSGTSDVMTEDANESFTILKIHGSVSRFQDLVIDKHDYQLFDESQLYMVSKLITYFVDYPVIFIGYSASDPDVIKILSSVKKIQQRMQQAPVLNNMWFVDWIKDEQHFDTSSEIKYIPLEGTETVGVNYIEMSSFTPLYRALFQNSVDVDALKTMEHTIYDIVKSASITKLQVDVANIQYMQHPMEFLRLLSKKNAFISLSQISDPDQLATVFVYTPTDVAHAVLGNHGNWQGLYRLIDELADKKGTNIRKSNNAYHVEMGNVSRYSEKAVNLLNDFKRGKKVEIEPFEQLVSMNPQSSPKRIDRE